MTMAHSWCTYLVERTLRVSLVNLGLDPRIRRKGHVPITTNQVCNYGQSREALGRRVSIRTLGEGWWPGAELNCRHYDFQSYALPTELPGRARTRSTTCAEPITISNHHKWMRPHGAFCGDSSAHRWTCSSSAPSATALPRSGTTAHASPSSGSSPITRCSFSIAPAVTMMQNGTRWRGDFSRSTLFENGLSQRVADGTLRVENHEENCVAACRAAHPRRVSRNARSHTEARSSSASLRCRARRSAKPRSPRSSKPGFCRCVRTAHTDGSRIPTSRARGPRKRASNPASCRRCQSSDARTPASGFLCCLFE